eukprot:CAMPEP_0168843968 /NCGR_PEP_ID=MMETSP0727-20121128/8494_1 /TAXON_ID=265536 /ORGANISM="Amphiprora sp., Strain CCMP467" /LENGTH=216 /DNA_ID=CAMNT_0008897595 /DNA_START=45 /DNA_END=695 /DNA_ORIENTATION=-
MVFAGFKNRNAASESSNVKVPRVLALSDQTDDSMSVYSEGSHITQATTRSIDHPKVGLIAMLNGDVSAKLIEKRASDLLQVIQSTAAVHIEQEKEAYKTMESGLELAKARYTSGNKVGATVSMRQVQRHQERLKILDQALNYIYAKEEEVVQLIHKLAEQSEKMYGDEAHTFCVSMESELSRLESFSKQVDKILSTENHKERSDEKLLAALVRQMD